MGRSRCSATVADATGPVAGDQDNVVGIATARGDVVAREFADAPRQSSVSAGHPADSVLLAAAVPVATGAAARCPDYDSSHLDRARLGFDRHSVDDASLAVVAAAVGAVVPNHDSTVATGAVVPAVAVLPIADDLASAVDRVDAAVPNAAVVLDSGVADRLNAVVAPETAAARVDAVPNAVVVLDSAVVGLVPVDCVVGPAGGPVQIDVLPTDSVVPVAVVPLRPGSAGFARHLVRVFPGQQRDQMLPGVRRINWPTLQAV